jgi:multidrug efflux pump
MLAVYTRAWISRCACAAVGADAADTDRRHVLFLFTQVKTSLFPPQDTGLIRGRATSGATVSFAGFGQRQQRLIDMLLRDRGCRHRRLASGQQPAGCQRPFDIELKTRAEGRKDDTFAALARLSAKAARYPDLNVRLRPIQDLPSFGGGGTNQGAQYQISLQGDDNDRAAGMAAQAGDRAEEESQAARRGQRLDDAGLQQNIVIDRDKAARLGIVDRHDRRCAVRRLRPAPGVDDLFRLNQYKVVVNALPNTDRHAGALNKIYMKSTSGQMMPLTAIRPPGARARRRPRSPTKTSTPRWI